MVVNRDDVRNLVTETIREILGEKEGVEIDEQTNPIRGLGLGSDDGVDFASGISEKLKYDIPNEINPFVDDTHHRPRRVGEIVDLLYKLLTAEGEKSHV